MDWNKKDNNVIKKLLVFSILSLVIGSVYSQELTAKLSINTDKLQGVDKAIFASLENSLLQMLNEQKWSENVFKQNEKIECDFILSLTASEGNTFSGDIQINSRRPVYNATYTTPIFVYKDTDIAFDYTQGEHIEFNESNITNNITAIFAFYINIVIGLDFDSFAPNGGKLYFEKAMNIVNASQSLAPKGWTAFENDRNRYALAMALTEESSSRFHNMWYTYHRLGLDEMGINALRARDKIIESTKDLGAIHEARPSSALLIMYGDTKLSELMDVYFNASKEEKKTAFEFLRKIYPTKTTELNALKRQD